MTNHWIKCSILAFVVCMSTSQARPSHNEGNVFVVYPEPIAKNYVDHTESMRFMPRTTKRVATTRKLSLNALARDEKDEKLDRKFVKSGPFEEEARYPSDSDAVAMSNTFNVTEISTPERRPIDYDSKISAVLLGILNDTVADSPEKKEDYTTFIGQTIGNVPQNLAMAALVNDMAPMAERANEEAPATMMATTPEESTTLTYEMMDLEFTTVTEGVESETVTNEHLV